MSASLHDQTDALGDTDRIRRAQDVRRFARVAAAAVVALALGAYALAWFLYTREQAPSALIVAVFGYFLLRSLRPIAWRLSHARFARQPGHVAVLAELAPEDLLGSRSGWWRRLLAAARSARR